MIDFKLNNYKLINSSDNIIPFKRKNQKVCRFCKKTSPEVSFNTVPHIIPELFGKNNITSNFECDNCNNTFQLYESSLSTLVLPYITLLGIRTKNKIPSFQSSKKNGKKATLMRIRDNVREFNFQNNLDDIKIDYSENKCTIIFRTKKFVPFHIHQILLKISISLLPESDLTENKHYLDHLFCKEPLNNGTEMPELWRYQLGNKIFKKPSAKLFKAKEVLVDRKEFPEYFLILVFGNIVFQYFLPLSKKNKRIHNKSNNISFEIFPAFYWNISKINKIEYNTFDILETRKVTIDEKIDLTFDKIQSDN